MTDGEQTPTTESTTEETKQEGPVSLLAPGQEPPPEETTDETVEGGDQTGAEEAETVEGGEAEETEAEGEGEESEAEVISSLSELIEQNEWDPEWLNGLKVPVKIDGEAGEATFKDLVASYQTQEAATRRLEEAKAKAKSMTEDVSKRAGELDTQFATAAKLIENAEALLNDDVSGIDWQKLRQDDPAEYAARKEEVKDRRERIEQMKREAVDSWRQGAEKQREEAQATLQERLQEEQAALLQKLPEWEDPEKAKAGKAKVAEYLIGEGFSREDVMGASDHRLVLLAEKARRYDEMKSSGDAARKKVTKVPKVLKPGPKGDQGKGQKDPSKMTMEEYAAWRKAGNG